MSEARAGTFRRQQQVSDEALRENERLRARVEALTAALDAISHNNCEDYSDNGYDSCAVHRPDDPDGWCAACIARDVLAAGEEKP